MTRSGAESRTKNQHSSVFKKDGDKVRNDSDIVDKEFRDIISQDPELSGMDPSVLDKISKNPRIISVLRRDTFSGPYPPPSVLAEYEKVLPGSAERIFALTDKEQEHRHSSQKTALSGTIKRDRRGQWMGFCITFLILVIASVFAWKGNTVFAGTLITIDLVSLAAVFVLGRPKNKKE